MAASKMLVCGWGSRRQWGDVVIRADAAIQAEAEVEEEEANAEGASLGFWKRVKRPVMQTLAGTTYIHIQAVVDMWGVGRPREQLLLTGPAHSSSLWEGTGRLASHIWLSRPVPPYSLQEGAGRHNEGAGRYHVGIWPSRPVHFCSPGRPTCFGHLTQWPAHPSSMWEVAGRPRNEFLLPFMVCMEGHTPGIHLMTHLFTPAYYIPELYVVI
ncbi:hypothetical protein F4604DRAFT_1673384 [Suillus subluteus]|nr:hypothetical protein F4604DRAFT_1673384 [Suillus subluteus]